jgi:hypothetical protein
MANTIDVQIGSQIVPIPAINADPNWAQGIITAIEALANSLNFTFGPNDVAPQEFIMQTNQGTNVVITPLAFAPQAVLAAYIYYAIYRTTTTNTEAESGLLTIVYNPSLATNSKWVVGRSFVGSSSVQFNVTDGGQVTYTSTLTPGSNFSGIITFKASTLQQTY